MKKHFHSFLAFVSAFSMVMSPVAQGAQAANQAQEFKTILESYKTPKVKTYGELWQNMRLRFGPKVRHKLDQWAFSMRNEKLPNVTYSSFIDKDGQEKLRMHLSQNGKTDTITFNNSEKKAFTINNVAISPTEVKDMDAIAFAMISRDEKYGRMAINSPTFDQRRPASSPMLLTAQEFFKLKPKQRVKYMQKLSEVADSVEQIQANQFKLIDMKANDKKNGAGLFDRQMFYDYAQYLYQAISPNAFADKKDVDSLRKPTTKLDAMPKDSNGHPPSGDSQVDVRELREKPSQTAAVSSAPKALKNPAQNGGSTNTLQVAPQSGNDLDRPAKESPRKQKKQGVSVIAGKYDYKPGKSCISGGFVGQIVKENKRTFCKQSTAAEGDYLTELKVGDKSYKNTCLGVPNRLACNPLMFGVRENSYICVARGGKNRDADDDRSVTQRCSIESTNPVTHESLSKLLGSFMDFKGEDCKDQNNSGNIKICVRDEQHLVNFQAWQEALKNSMADSLQVCQNLNDIKNKQIKDDQADTCDDFIARYDALINAQVELITDQEPAKPPTAEASTTCGTTADMKNASYDPSSKICRCTTSNESFEPSSPNICPSKTCSEIRHSDTSPSFWTKLFNPFWSMTASGKQAMSQKGMSDASSAPKECFNWGQRFGLSLLFWGGLAAVAKNQWFDSKQKGAPSTKASIPPACTTANCSCTTDADGVTKCTDQVVPDPTPVTPPVTPAETTTTVPAADGDGVPAAQ